MPSAFFTAYSEGHPEAVALLPPGFRDAGARIGRARRAAGRRLDPALLEVLREQNNALATTGAREKNLEALGRPGTAVVVTGQQMGLFMGPLYTFYKAASTIVTARALTRESGVPCIPLFWLQTEDHDFPEIAECRVPAAGGGEPHVLRMSDGGVSARVSVAHRRLCEDIGDEVDTLAQALDTLPGTNEMIEFLRVCWRPGRRIADAFADQLATVFAEEGLILLDSRVRAVARLAVPVFRTALERAGEIDSALAERGQFLRSHGWAEQVHPRAGVTLPFVHEEGPEGPRFRVAPRPDLVALLARDPMCFSTSALLRPLVQDSLLPTAAYVAGPAEIGYFAQVAALYPLFGLEPPIVTPRARLRCLDAATRTLLDKVGLSAADLEGPAEELPTSTTSFATEAWRTRLLGVFGTEIDALAAAGEALDANLREPTHKTRQTVEHAVDRLLARYDRATSEHDQVGKARLARLRAILAPGGTPQERCFGLPYFAAYAGLQPFKQQVLAAIRPFDATIGELHLERGTP